MSGADNAARVKFHLSLNVSSLEKALAFYRILLGRAPAKVRADYAKFELDDPPLVLSLEPHRPGSGGVLNHAGFRLPDSAALVEVQKRLEAAGIATQRQEGVECCYARQTKFWVTDPDRTLWEVYVLEEDIDHRGAGQALEDMIPAQVEEDIDWELRLGEKIPQTIPLADGSVREVRLPGVFNGRHTAEARDRLLQEAFRVLRPGGGLLVHVLTADRPFPSGLKPLPGPAARVEQVPLDRDILAAVEAAGFGALHLEKFAASPCFVQGEVEMRETLLRAVKVPPGTGKELHAVLYKGPHARVVDDRGTEYRRGQRTLVDRETWDWLREGPMRDGFTFMENGSSTGKPVRVCLDRTV